MNVTKRPCLASYFSRDRRALEQEVIDAFRHPVHGPLVAAVPPISSSSSGKQQQQQSDRGSLFSAIVPHGAACDGFVVASHAYNELDKFLKLRKQHQQQQQQNITVVVIGNSHSPIGATPVVLSSELFETPLGPVPVNEALCTALHQRAGIPINNQAHRREHSIENQLPFLQRCFFSSDHNNHHTTAAAIRFSIVPILVANTFERVSELDEVASRIASVIIEETTNHKSNNNVSVIIIGSTDFSHVGPFYGELPPRGQSIVDYTRQRDGAVIQALLELNTSSNSNSEEEEEEEFRRRMEKFVSLGSRTSACGIWSAAMTVMLTKKLREGGKEASSLSSPSSQSSSLLNIRMLKYAVASELFERPDVTGFGAFVL